MVSILGEYNYSFPKKKKLKLRLKDLLEDKVDEKYYLSQEMVDFFVEDKKEKIDKGGECIPIKTANSTGYINAYEGDAIDISSRMQWHRGTVQKQRSLTIDTQCMIGVVVKDEGN